MHILPTLQRLICLLCLQANLFLNAWRQPLKYYRLSYVLIADLSLNTCVLIKLTISSEGVQRISDVIVHAPIVGGSKYITDTTTLRHSLFPLA